MKRIITAISLVFLCIVMANAQQRVVTGTVTSSEDGASLPGVNVIIKGSTTGSVSDANGKYSITVPSANSILIFSFIGLKSEEVAIGERSVIDISLSLDIVQLSEIVVTGVGVATEKKKIAIDVASLGSKDISQSAVASIDQALQGKIAGAQIRINSGEPGSAVNIQLRGINSLGSTQPMIMVDGVQVPEGTANSALSSLDMTNVERFEVVKGAAAGMLYGAQGANGVIQIFTKKGSGAPQVTVSTKTIFGEILKGNTPLTADYHHFKTDSDGYIVDGKNSRIAANKLGLWTDPVYQDATLNPLLVNATPYKEQLYDHLGQAYRKSVSENTTVNINGSTNKFDYNLNANLLKQQSVLNNTLKRKNIGVNLGVEIVKNLKVRSTTQLVFQDENLISIDRFAMVNNFPWIDFKANDTTGYYAFQVKKINGRNPLSQTQWENRWSKDNRIIQSFNANYKFPKFVEIDYTYGVQIFNTENYDYYANQAGRNIYWGTNINGSVFRSQAKSTFQNSLLKAFVRFDLEKDFKLNLPITTLTQFAYDWRKDNYGYFSAQGTGLPTFPPANLNVAANPNISDYSQSFLTFGYLINQTIDYKNIAGISGGIRSDYSSEFGFNNNNISPFNFKRWTAYFRPVEFISSSFLGEWKLRAAYGEAGIQPAFASRQVTFNTEPLGSAVALYNPAVAKNAGLKVQRSSELEYGSDFTFISPSNGKWFSKVDISATYFTRKSTDVIQNAPSSPSTGASGLISNLVDLKSSGIDINLDAGIFKSNFLNWNFGIRFGKVKTDVTRLSGGLPQIYGSNGLYSTREGTQIGSFYGQYVIRSLDALKPDGTPYVPAGKEADYTVASTQYGDVVINKLKNTALISATNDKKIIGNPQPKFTMSFINNFTIKKDLQVSIQVDWWYGQDIYNQTRQWLYRDRVSKDFDLSISPNGEAEGAYVAFYNSLYNSVFPTSWFVEKGSFARLRDLSISYDLKNLLKLKGIRQVAISLSGRNLLTITKYRGLDPEAVSAGIATGSSSNSGDNTSVSSSVAGAVGPARGVDSFSFPNLKTYQLGITIGF